jgi:hypothetical protein
MDKITPKGRRVKYGGRRATGDIWVLGHRVSFPKIGSCRAGLWGFGGIAIPKITPEGRRVKYGGRRATGDIRVLGHQVSFTKIGLIETKPWHMREG